jgi:hypothetical protein
MLRNQYNLDELTTSFEGASHLPQTSQLQQDHAEYLETHHLTYCYDYCCQFLGCFSICLKFFLGCFNVIAKTVVQIYTHAMPMGAIIDEAADTAIDAATAGAFIGLDKINEISRSQQQLGDSNPEITHMFHAIDGAVHLTGDFVVQPIIKMEFVSLGVPEIQAGIASSLATRAMEGAADSFLLFVEEEVESNMEAENTLYSYLEGFRELFEGVPYDEGFDEVC